MCKVLLIFLKFYLFKEERKKNDYMYVNGIVLVLCWKKNLNIIFYSRLLYILKLFLDKFRSLCIYYKYLIIYNIYKFGFLCFINDCFKLIVMRRYCF